MLTNIIVSTNKCDSLTSSPSDSSSSDEEPTSQRNGSYDLVLAEENTKNQVMSSQVEFPTKRYEIITKNKVVKNSSLADNNTDMVTHDKNEINSSSDTSYRESWKARNKAEQQNTMVFNFTNVQRDVTHIENDGLDLSKRSSTKKKTQIQLSKVRPA